ncbi:hypothetical protein [Chitinophaga sp. Cy-1792]|uniref:hypothetical protein n=1 Tax=Chitinophaga sp. Cy-1792 TaxID=2608339 RepID=UPI00141F5835|nr:hypothetical protein [Chitinophaga sp. Cy-1792]NIG56521.1 hypothetical protein [Chitinophaga sp. Cy-1792]
MEDLIKKNNPDTGEGGPAQFGFLLLFFGVIIVLMSVSRKKEKYFRASDLKEATIVLSDSPIHESIPSGKTRRSKYILPTTSISCTPIIEETSLSVLESDNNTVNIFHSLKTGDSLLITMLSVDEWKISSSTSELNLMGCSFNGQTLFRPDQVLTWNNNSATWSIYTGFLMIFISIGILITQLVIWIKNTDFS